MQVSTASFEALTAEVARLAGLVDGFAQRTIAVEAIYQAGRATERALILGGQHSLPRARRKRPGHLNVVADDPGGAT